MRFLIRAVDFTASLLGLVILSPFLILVSFLIWREDKHSPFFLQERVGLNFKLFQIVKFRSMSPNKSGLLITSSTDNRITKIGSFIRKYKIDELPQLFNVFRGQMSLVGPRPEVEFYVNQYTQEQKEIIKVKPGVTDYASILYRDENDLLSKSLNPEETYINIIMPRKIRLNRVWVDNYSLRTYFDCILRTLVHILRY
ncbi:sugar transferase [Schleiferiaceae bacterium]|nr:sugar transferase [Schleiferiaceae bacterium]